jgi:hypothetical protein
MTNQQRGILVAVFAVALVGGGLLAFLLVNRGGSGGVSNATTSPEAQVSLPASAAPSESASVTPSEPPSAVPSVSTPPSPTPTATPAPTPTATLPPPAPATVTFSQLKMDASTDPNGHTRRITWQTAGNGPVKVTVKNRSSHGTVDLCVARAQKIVKCIHTADGSITSTASATARDFALSVIGIGSATPAIDLTITFPARAPSVQIVRARFDGTDFPETNGIQVIVTPRHSGDVTIDADWGAPFKYELDLFEQAGDHRSQQFPNQGPASNVQQTFAITGTNPWKLVLQNIDNGNAPTQMTATIGWP